METIKNYLETMFRNLPNTEQVLKAKNELLQMMEDKYSELIAEGISENEAVGTVISEFGNLDELSQTLGLESVLSSNKEKQNRRSLSLDEVKEYLGAVKLSGLLRALSTFFFITCVTPLIILRDNKFGIALMFTFIALGIGFSVASGFYKENWKFIKTSPCSVSPEVIDYVNDERKKFNTPYSLMHAFGVILCALCFVPDMYLDNISFGKGAIHLSGSYLFLSIGLGVFLLIYSRKIFNSFKTILNINDECTVGGEYASRRMEAEKEIKNPKIRALMSVYWSSITCVYLCVSFLTFDWHLTWIIWPIASVIFSMLKNIYGEEK